MTDKFNDLMALFAEDIATRVAAKLMDRSPTDPNPPAPEVPATPVATAPRPTVQVVTSNTPPAAATQPGEVSTALANTYIREVTRMGVLREGVDTAQLATDLKSSIGVAIGAEHEKFIITEGEGKWKLNIEMLNEFFNQNKQQLETILNQYAHLCNA